CADPAVPALPSPAILFFCHAPPPTDPYPLSLHDALPISNRETWAFMLHLNNDQGLYEMGRDWAREAIAEWREYGNDDESGGYADRVIGERVVWQAIELWADHEDDLATRGGYSTDDPIVMWQREVGSVWRVRSEEHTSELQSRFDL